MTKRYVFCYDIANPKRLYRVARILEAVGERVQESVFECWLEARQFNAVRGKLLLVLKQTEDRILVYQLTSAEGDDIRLIGTAFTTDDINFVVQ